MCVNKDTVLSNDIAVCPLYSFVHMTDIFRTVSENQRNYVMDFLGGTRHLAADMAAIFL